MTVKCWTPIVVSVRCRVSQFGVVFHSSSDRFWRLISGCFVLFWYRFSSLHVFRRRFCSRRTCREMFKFYRFCVYDVQPVFVSRLLQPLLCYRLLYFVWFHLFSSLSQGELAEMASSALSLESFCSFALSLILLFVSCFSVMEIGG